MVGFVKKYIGLSLLEMGMIPKENCGILKVDQGYKCRIFLEFTKDEDEVISYKHYYHISCINEWFHQYECCAI
jgi:hypothetical protein